MCQLTAGKTMSIFSSRGSVQTQLAELHGCGGFGVAHESQPCGGALPHGVPREIEDWCCQTGTEVDLEASEKLGWPRSS